MYQTKAYSAASATSLLAPTTIPRREPTELDVQIEILFCGICHSDLHTARNEWSSIMQTVYPCVPGHEIVGRVTNIGSAVTKHQPGDLVGVGCLVDSDQSCPCCRDNLEQLCPNGIFTTSPHKRDDALRLGADEVVVSRHADEMQKHAGSLNFILDCVAADHDVNAYLNLLRHDGDLTLVGAPENPLSISAFALLFGRRSLSGSLIGGIAETQEMLDFCGGHNITSDVEVIPIQKINEAYERMVRSDVKYRFSIDMASLRSE